MLVIRLIVLASKAHPSREVASKIKQSQSFRAFYREAVQYIHRDLSLTQTVTAR